jgi:hypothetical protein
MGERKEIRAEQTVRAVLPALVADRIVADNLFGRLAWHLYVAELDGESGTFWGRQRWPVGWCWRARSRAALFRAKAW